MRVSNSTVFGDNGLRKVFACGRRATFAGAAPRSLRKSLLRAAAVVALGAVAVGSVGNHAAADTIRLKSGRVLHGRLRRHGPYYMITVKSGKRILVPLNQLVSVQLTGSSSRSGRAPAGGDYQALLIRLKNLRSAKAAVAQIKTYLTTHPKSAHAAAARKKLEFYQNVMRKHWVRFQGSWAPRAQRSKLQRQMNDQGAMALRQYNNGRVKQALNNANAILRAAPRNQLALAVAGLANYRLGYKANSRRDFMLLARANPESSLAWNNLGVLNFSQHRQPEALLDYRRALQNASNNRIILDNIAGALHAYKGDRRTALFRSLSHQFTQSERLLESSMARRGWYPYGNVWITAKQRRRVRKFNVSNASLVQNLQGSFTQDRHRLRATIQRIRMVEARIVRMESAIVELDLQAQQQAPETLTATTSLSVVDADTRALTRDRRARSILLQRKQRLIWAIKHIRRDARGVKPKGLVVAYLGQPEMLEPGEVRHPPMPLHVSLHLSTRIAALPHVHRRRRRFRPRRPLGLSLGDDQVMGVQPYFSSYPFYPFGFFAPGMSTYPNPGNGEYPGNGQPTNPYPPGTPNPYPPGPSPIYPPTGPQPTIPPVPPPAPGQQQQPSIPSSPQNPGSPGTPVRNTPFARRDRGRASRRDRSGRGERGRYRIAERRHGGRGRYRRGVGRQRFNNNFGNAGRGQPRPYTPTSPTPVTPTPMTPTSPTPVGPGSPGTVQPW